MDFWSSQGPTPRTGLECRASWVAIAGRPPEQELRLRGLQTIAAAKKGKWRYSLAGCKVRVYEHPDGAISLSYGPHIVGRYAASAAPLQNRERPLKRRRLRSAVFLLARASNNALLQ